MEPYPYRILFGYLYSWGTSACVPQVYKKFSKKKKSFSFIFSFGYVIKINKSSKRPFNGNGYILLSISVTIWMYTSFIYSFGS